MFQRINVRGYVHGVLLKHALLGFLEYVDFHGVLGYLTPDVLHETPFSDCYKLLINHVLPILGIPGVEPWTEGGVEVERCDDEETNRHPRI